MDAAMMVGGTVRPVGHRLGAAEKETGFANVAHRPAASVRGQFQQRSALLLRDFQIDNARNVRSRLRSAGMDCGAEVLPAFSVASRGGVPSRNPLAANGVCAHEFCRGALGKVGAMGCADDGIAAERGAVEFVYFPLFRGGRVALLMQLGKGFD